MLLHTDITQKPPIWSAITLSNQEHLLQQKAINLAETDHDTSLILLPFTSHSHTHILKPYQHPSRVGLKWGFQPPLRCCTCLCVWVGGCGACLFNATGDGRPNRATNCTFPLHGTVRHGSVRYGSVRVGLRFHRSLVPL